MKTTTITTLMNEREAWLYLHDKFIEDSKIENFEDSDSKFRLGICYALNDLHLGDKINSLIYLRMASKVQKLVKECDNVNITDKGIFLFPTRRSKFVDWKPEYSIKRAEICKKFADEL